MIKATFCHLKVMYKVNVSESRSFNPQTGGEANATRYFEGIKLSYTAFG